MERKKFLKLILVILVIEIILLITNIGEVNAALQANPNTQYTKKDNPVNFIKEFRNMEKSGQAMGLNETINTNLTSTSGSNNMDVHMMKATEYGAIAILSASGYGNSNNEPAITSTTGNKTGIIINTNQWEWVAGGMGGQYGIFKTIDERYYNAYTTSQESAKVGDALGNATTMNQGCTSWHNANNQGWIDSGWNAYFVRGYGGIFSYNGTWYYNNGNSFLTYSRGTVVCGDGI